MPRGDVRRRRPRSRLLATLAKRDASSAAPDGTQRSHSAAVARRRPRREPSQLVRSTSDAHGCSCPPGPATSTPAAS